MTEMPCDDCANLIGAVSAASPHSELKVQTLKLRPRTGARDNRAVFYRCRKCQILMMRDLYKEDPSAQWDWVKTRNAGDSSTFEMRK